MFVSLSLLFVSIVAVHAANPGTAPDPQLEKLFEKEFASAEHVAWSVEEGYNKASFILAGRRAIAWYDMNRQLVGTIRDLSFDQLPLAVIRSLQSKFQDAVMMTMYEISNQEGTRYKVTLEYKGKKYSASFYTDGQIANTKRLTK